MNHSPVRSATAVVLTLLAAAPMPALAEEASTPEQIVDVMNTLWGKHPGVRANHAKGAVVEGSFTPSPEAASLSKASLFKGPTVPVTARFSNATGLPTIPDGSPKANPHGLAIRFKLTEGDMDVVVNSLKYFPVATGEEFRDLLTAVSKSGPDAPKPTPVETFVASHPAAGKAGATAKTPTSVARQIFNGINAFVLVDATGKRRAFRWRFVPVDGEELMPPEEAAKQSPTFLMDEIRTRLAKAPVAYRVEAQLAEAGDPTNDATKPWPEERRSVVLGTLNLTKPVADSLEAEKALLFLPNALTDGVEVSDDPLIDTRVQAYAVSFGRRSQ